MSVSAKFIVFPQNYSYGKSPSLIYRPEIPADRSPITVRNIDVHCQPIKGFECAKDH